jgi:cell division transport system permease protein
MSSRRTKREQKVGSPSASISVRNRIDLVPSDTTAGRALVTVISIMTFLAAITAGCAIFISDAASEWQSQISRELTIQIKPTDPKLIDDQVAKVVSLAQATPGLSDIRAFSQKDSEKMLEPWLGAGVDLSELSIPRMIAVKVDPARRADLKIFQEQLKTLLPNAQLDDHRQWIDRLAAMARTLVWVAVFVLLLVITAMALAVAFATRGAMAGSKHIIDVLHFVGAEDRFIAVQFQKIFLRLGLKGGVIGGACALLLFAASAGLSQFWTLSPGGDQLDALFGTFSLGVKGYMIVALIAVLIALLTGYMSRLVVFRHLSGLE